MDSRVAPGGDREGGGVFDQSPPAATASNSNTESSADRAAHAWFRFVLSFPPHLVRHYLHRFGVGQEHLVLDPFCGTATTLIECRKLGICGVGIEAHPLLQFVSRVKVDWTPDPAGLSSHAALVAQGALRVLAEQGLRDAPGAGSVPPHRDHLRTLPHDAAALLLKDSISPLPLHKVLVLLDQIESQRDERYHQHERLALAHALVSTIGNLRFGPEVGLATVKMDAAVIAPWLQQVERMAADLCSLPEGLSPPAQVLQGDARRCSALLPPQSIDAVFTSSPYPNEKDYTRTTRLEAVLLGFLSSREELRALKRSLLTSNSRAVYRGEEEDERWASIDPGVIRLAQRIEQRRSALGKTSGFERAYAPATRRYFGGMARHLSDLRSALRPGALLGYVVGEQASYFQVLIPTGQHLSRIAAALGYDVLGRDLFRERRASTTGALLREEVVVLRWPG